MLSSKVVVVAVCGAGLPFLLKPNVAQGGIRANARGANTTAHTHGIPSTTAVSRLMQARPGMITTRRSLGAYSRCARI